MRLATRRFHVPRLSRRQVELLVAVLAALVFLVILVAFLTARTAAAC